MGGVCQPSCFNFAAPSAAGGAIPTFRESERIPIFAAAIPAGMMSAPDLPPPKPSHLA